MSESAVVLENPKYPHNVGGALRACASFGATEFYWNGARVVFNVQRLPRAERMRHYRQSVRFAQDQGALDRLIEQRWIPVAVEVKPKAENLLYFEHPKKAVYVFGLEDGSLSKEILQVCHRFVFIPTHYCLN